MTCPICGGNNLCDFTNETLCISEYYHLLNTDDWEEIYNFMRTVYLPTIHKILVQAEKRIKDHDLGR